MPVIPGLNYRQIAMRAAWAERVAKYGPQGLTSAGIEARRACGRLMAEKNFAQYKRRQTLCKRNHPLTPENTYINARGGRTCRECVRLWKRERYRRLKRGGRPDWIEQGKARISIAVHDAHFISKHQRLREQMIAAHPDKGGTSARFVKARKAFDRFMAAEHHWYAQFHLVPPSKVVVVSGPRAVPFKKVVGE